MNQSSSNQITEAQTANLDALVGLANNAFEGFEKLLDLNIQTVKTALVETQEGAQKALSVKDTQELIAVETDLLRPMPDKALSYQRNLYKIASDTQAALDKVAEAQYEANKHEMTNFVKGAAPWDSGTADAVLQAVIGATDLLFESMRNAAKQMTQAAESSLQASADAVASARQLSDEQASQKAAQ